MDFFETLIGDVGVDLGSGDGSVTEHGLDASDVSSIREEIRCETMAERMRMDIF